jgi:hypothetical protein
MTERPPAELWLGMEDHRWPVQAFTAEPHVMIWLRDGAPAYPRRAWKVRVEVIGEVELVSPEPYLQEKPART